MFKIAKIFKSIIYVKWHGMAYLNGVYLNSVSNQSHGTYTIMSLNYEYWVPMHILLTTNLEDYDIIYNLLTNRINIEIILTKTEWLSGLG